MKIALVLMLCIAVVRMGYPVLRQRVLVQALRSQGFEVTPLPVWNVRNPLWLRNAARAGVWRAIFLQGGSPDCGTAGQIGMFRELFALTYNGFQEPAACKLLLSDSAMTDAGLAELLKARHLKSISVASRQLTDASLGQLRHVPHLESISLRSPHFTNKGLATLGDTRRIRLDVGGQHLTSVALLHLPGLETANDIRILPVYRGATKLPAIYAQSQLLHMYLPVVQSEHLEKLSHLRRLKLLVLSGPDISDATFAHVHDLPALETLDLRQSDVTSASLSNLAKFPNLRILFLDQTRITDAGFENILKCPNLGSLTIRYTAISDASLPVLEKLQERCHIHLLGTHISDDGRFALLKNAMRLGKKFVVR